MSTFHCLYLARDSGKIPTELRPDLPHEGDGGEIVLEPNL